MGGGQRAEDRNKANTVRSADRCPRAKLAALAAVSARVLENQVDRAPRVLVLRHVPRPALLPGNDATREKKIS